MFLVSNVLSFKHYYAPYGFRMQSLVISALAAAHGQIALYAAANVHCMVSSLTACCRQEEQWTTQEADGK